VSFFSRYVARITEENPVAFFEDYRNRLIELKEKFENGEITSDDYKNNQESDFPELNSMNNFRMLVQNIKKLNFGLAHNIYYPTPGKAGLPQIKAYVYNGDFELMHIIDKDHPIN